MDDGKLAIYNVIFEDPNHVNELEPMIKPYEKIGELDFELGMIMFKKTA